MKVKAVNKATIKTKHPTQIRSISFNFSAGQKATSPLYPNPECLEFSPSSQELLKKITTPTPLSEI